MTKKKTLLGIVMAACMMLIAVPAFAADGNVSTEAELKAALADTNVATITLDQYITLSEPLSIDRAVTIDGQSAKHALTYNGSKPALTITAKDAVALKNLTINAKATGAYGIALTSSQPNLTITDSNINADTRGVDMSPVDGCTGGKLTLNGTSILNSRISDYENNATVADTRGLSLFDAKNSTITITGSSIKGFGYSINTSATEDESTGTRPASNQFDITGSNIWGWSAFNIWTVGNTFNLTNCDLRGINSSNALGNSFSVINIVKGIYGNSPETAPHNVFNLTGGALDAKMTVNTAFVEETVIYLGNQFETEFHFSKSGYKKVAMTCDKAFSAIIAEAKDATGAEDPAFADWAMTDKLTGPENTSYNQGSTSIFFPNRGLIAPGVYAGKTKPAAAAMAVDESPVNAATEHHIGGENA